MNVLFFNFIVFFFFVMSPVLAMEDEEAPKHIQAILPQQKAAEEDALPLSIVPIESIPDELLVVVFKFLEVPDLGRVTQVSKHFQKLAEDSDVWKHAGLKYYGDYLSEEGLKENPKQIVISHYLSVIVNETENLEQIERLINYYQLHLYVPFFKQYVKPIFLTGLETNLPNSKEFIVQTTPEIIWKKIDRLCAARGQCSGYPQAARDLNDLLVERGNPKAINRKIESLTQDGKQGVFFGYSGWTGNGDGILEYPLRPFTMIPLHGYRKNISEAREFIELLVKTENPTGIERKMEGLTEGKYGYEQDLETARELNEFFVRKGNQQAIERKINGLLTGRLGYERDLEMARKINDFLVEKGNSEAISRKFAFLYSENPSAAREFIELLVERGNRDQRVLATKIIGLAEGTHGYDKDSETVRRFIDSLDDQNANEWKYHGILEGKYGYEKDSRAAREFNDLLVEKGDQDAIERKYYGLLEGKYGYEKDPVAAKELNELLVEQGDPQAINRKIEGHEKGGFCYEKGPMAAREFNYSLVEKGTPNAIKRKIQGLIKGGYGYEKDPSAAREFIERLVICEFPVARGIGKYLKAFAMKYGISELGYEKNRQKAIKFIRKNHVPY